MNIKDILLLVLYSILNTGLNLTILYIINSKINVHQTNYFRDPGWVFFIAVVLSYLLNIFFQRKIIRFSHDFVYDNELKLAGRIQQLPFQQKERLKTERIYGILEDLRMFVYLAGVVSNTLNAVLMILLCIGYLFFISFSGAIMTIILILAIVFVYIIVGKKLSYKLHLLRDYNDHFNKLADDVIRGFKELKVSLIRSNNLLVHHLKVNRSAAKEVDTALTGKFAAVNVLSQYGLYLIFGVVLFLFPLLHVLQINQAASFVMVLLFMSGPVNRLISMQNLYTRLQVAGKRIQSFFSEIEVNKFYESAAVPETKIAFSKIEMRNCIFRHNESFQLGPVNFSIESGEVVFVIGGNGSGKSTFINMLTGLYAPLEGEILLNGTPVQSSLSAYQDLLSVVFTDNYIFSRNYDGYELEGNDLYTSLISFMQMGHVIKDSNDASIRRPFSKGQSKRVSLMLALLEDHPILVLDEWAADQDPYFRKYFYEKVIPWLKKKGKTIIAVTHDDAYFNSADRIIKFDEGNIVMEVNVKLSSFNPSMLWSK